MNFVIMGRIGIILSPPKKETPKGVLLKFVFVKILYFLFFLFSKLVGLSVCIIMVHPFTAYSTYLYTRKPTFFSPTLVGKGNSEDEKGEM